MKPIGRKTLAGALILLAVLVGIGFAAGNIGRFTPTHAIKEPVYCGVCHPDQVAELNATTHLPHFAQAIYEEAEAVTAPNSASITTAEAVAGGCMMCHNTWVNREKIYVNAFELTDNVSGSGQYQLKYNDVVFSATNSSTQYDIAVTANATNQTVRLGTSVSGITVTVQDPGTSGLVAGAKLVNNTDYVVNSTHSIDLVNTSTNVTALEQGDGAIKVVYTVNTGSPKNLKQVWGELSARSPTAGAFYNDQTGGYSCGNPEKGFCHAVETTLGLNLANKMPENTVLGNKQAGSGNGIFFRHEMAYTSAEYAAKQVKLCGACHFNKLPPMTADGEPIRQTITDTPKVVRTSHGVTFETNITTISSEWAHKQVQCIRCHGHAGIGTEDDLTGVRSN